MEYATLNNGTKVPMIGLGTSALPNDQFERIIGQAYEVGYRKIDTAWLYGNEKAIGDAIKRLKLSREELFITSKLHINDLYFLGYHSRFNVKIKTIHKAFEGSLRRLGTDYLDLYLIHWPFVGYEKMWEELVKLNESGQIKAIGVSSFLIPHLEKIKDITGIIPMVNQFEINPFNTQKPLIEYCKKNNVHVEAYATFGTTRQNESASQDIMNHDNVLKISQAHDKTPSQIILRWAVQQGVSVIPRSKSANHLRENIELFDFKLSGEEMSMIDALNQDKYSRGNPYKTLN
jgi:diketogulonate reductase-like aldo/keto reductase